MEWLNIAILFSFLGIAISNNHDKNDYDHGHRHRHLHRLHHYQTRHQAMSLNDWVGLVKKDNYILSLAMDKQRCSTGESLCSNPSLKFNLIYSIARTLNFYESHLENLADLSNLPGLASLQAIESKHGSIFQLVYPISDWISKICELFRVRRGSVKDAVSCKAYAEAVAKRSSSWNSWHEPQALDSYAETLSGNEKEEIWGPLNTYCVDQLVVNCEIPAVCKRVMLDPEPKSQYMLTHQLQYRMLVETSYCLPDRESYVSPSVNRELCGKMLQEAEFLAMLDDQVPLTMFRDLFLEHVSFCASIGYSSFLRKDWLEKILSWQSKSENGCFLTSSKDVEIESMEGAVVRELTTAEKMLGETSSGELCDPHFTSVALSALASFWDYMQENCEKQSHNSTISDYV